MPTGIYKRTKEIRKKISKGLKGHKVSKETREKIGNVHRGKIVSKEARKKMSKIRMGKIQTKEHIKNKVESRKGYRHSEETKEKIKKSNTGNFKGTLRREKHYNWQGGISNNPYSVDWTETLRRSIRERDNYICQLCSKLQGDIALPVHHIDYNKQNCNPNNLITLCANCHCKTNFNREYWTKYFNKKL